MADRARHHRQLLARLGLLRRFARADDGAAAIEFAFVAIPFLILVFAIIELGLTFLVSMTPGKRADDRRPQDPHRRLPEQQRHAASFRQAVCDEMSWLGVVLRVSITLDVRVLPAFEKAKTLKPPKTAPPASIPAAPARSCWCAAITSGR
jgi:hypothetical protein